jgi:hypothetical protein
VGSSGCVATLLLTRRPLRDAIASGASELDKEQLVDLLKKAADGSKCSGTASAVGFSSSGQSRG